MALNMCLCLGMCDKQDQTFRLSPSSKVQHACFGTLHCGSTGDLRLNKPFLVVANPSTTVTPSQGYTCLPVTHKRAACGLPSCSRTVISCWSGARPMPVQQTTSDYCTWPRNMQCCCGSAAAGPLSRSGRLAVYPLPSRAFPASALPWSAVHCYGIFEGECVGLALQHLFMVLASQVGPWAGGVR